MACPRHRGPRAGLRPLLRDPPRRPPRRRRGEARCSRQKRESSTARRCSASECARVLAPRQQAASSGSPLEVAWALAPRTRARLRRGVLPLRGAEGPDAPDRRRLRRRDRALLLHARHARGECSPASARRRASSWRRAPRGRHAVLLLLRGAALHRLRHDRRSARRHLLVPGFGPDGERDRPRSPLRPLRVEGRCPLRGNRALDRDRVGPRDRAAASRELGRALGLPHPRRAPEARKKSARSWARPAGPGTRGGARHRRQGLALRPRRDRGRRRYPRLRAAGLHGIVHGARRVVVGAARRADRHPALLERGRDHPDRAGVCWGRARRSARCSLS